MKSFLVISLTMMSTLSFAEAGFKSQTCRALNVFAQEQLEVKIQGAQVAISYSDLGTDLIYQDVLKAVKDVGLLSDDERLNGLKLDGIVDAANGGRITQHPSLSGLFEVILAKPMATISFTAADGQPGTRQAELSWANVRIHQETLLYADGSSATSFKGSFEMYRSGHPYYPVFNRSFDCVDL